MTCWRRSVSSDVFLSCETSTISGSFVFVPTGSSTTHASLFPTATRRFKPDKVDQAFKSVISYVLLKGTGRWHERQSARRFGCMSIIQITTFSPGYLYEGYLLLSILLRLAMADLLAVGPVHPDFYFCDAFYSSGVLGHINAADCVTAERQMPRGAAPVTWSSSRLDEENVHPFEIPKIYLDGRKSDITQGT